MLVSIVVVSVGGICLIFCINVWLCVVIRLSILVLISVFVMLESEKGLVVEMRNIVLGVD